MNIRALTLGLLVCGLAQLVIAGHQFQHADGPATDVCAICLQVDHLYAPTAAVVTSMTAAPQATTTDRHTAPLAAAATVASYDSRAPPHS